MTRAGIVLLMAAGLALGQEAKLAATPEAQREQKAAIDRALTSLRANIQPDPATRPQPIETPVPAHKFEIPADWKPNVVIPPPAATQAIQLSEAWAREGAMPTAGKDGRVVFTFGAGLPVIACAPLKVCVIELERGERLTGEPKIGDSVRWDISPAMVGPAENAVPLIVIKPRTEGLDTNLVIPTNRRAYYLRLISDSDKYTACVSFAYPDSSQDAWQAQINRQNGAIAARAAELPAHGVVLSGIENLHFGYAVKSSADWLRPVFVVDDGRQTVIQMPQAMASREAPVLMAEGPHGEEMVNYRVLGTRYVVDRLFEKATLRVGAGKKAQHAEIVRQEDSHGIQ